MSDDSEARQGTLAARLAEARERENDLAGLMQAHQRRVLASNPPRRAHHLVIEAGADDQRALVALLRHFLYLIETGSRSVVSGGYDSGGSFTYTTDETITHDRYFELSDAWLRAREAHADSDPGQRVAPL